jgi:hypothetical protein
MTSAQPRRKPRVAGSALFSHRQCDADHASGHIGSACAGKWRNIESDAAAIRGTPVSAEARVQVSAAVQGHPVGAYRAAKKAVLIKNAGTLAAVIGRL